MSSSSRTIVTVHLTRLFDSHFMKERRNRCAVLPLPRTPLRVGQALEHVTWGMLCRTSHETGWIVLLYYFV